MGVLDVQDCTAEAFQWLAPLHGKRLSKLVIYVDGSAGGSGESGKQAAWITRCPSTVTWLADWLPMPMAI